MRPCPYCGHEVLKSERYCPNCGRIRKAPISLDKYSLGMIETLNNVLFINTLTLKAVLVVANIGISFWCINCYLWLFYSPVHS